MTTRNHITNLKIKIKVAFQNALDHFNLLDLYVDDGTYSTNIAEFEAGLDLLDTLVDDDDTFTSPKAAAAVRSALVTFFNSLEDDAMRRLRVAVLLDEIDAPTTTAEAGR